MIFSSTELAGHSVNYLRSVSQFEAYLAEKLVKLVATKKSVEILFATIADKYGLSYTDGFVIKLLATVRNKGYIVIVKPDRYRISLRRRSPR